MRFRDPDVDLSRKSTRWFNDRLGEGAPGTPTMNREELKRHKFKNQGLGQGLEVS